MELENDPYQKKLSEILTALYANKEFLESVLLKTRKSVQSVKYAFADIIRYYIMSRDENIYENYEQICEKDAEFNKSRPRLITDDGKIDPNYREKYSKWYHEICERIDTNGYLTHSFYGKEGELIRKYGLNYTKHWSEEEKYEYMEAQQALIRLLKFFNNSTYKVNSYRTIRFESSRMPSLDSRLIYFTTPGDTTFLYTLDGSPTILYEQLLRGFNDELGDLKGKTKKEKIREILKNRAKNLKYLGIRSEAEEIQKYGKQFASSDIDTVVDYYCYGNQGFALVRIADIRNSNIKLGVGDLKETGNNEYSFDELIAREEERIIESKKNWDNIKRVKGNPRESMYYPEEFFSSDADTQTWSFFENFCAKAEDLDCIPVYCVFCLDAFDVLKTIQEIKSRENDER